MKFLTFVKEYVQEHPHLTFKEAMQSDNVKCLYHKAGKATYCKDDDSKGVVVNVNCCPPEEKEEESKPTPKSIQRSYTTPQPALPPRVVAPMPALPPMVPFPPTAPIKKEKIKKEKIKKEIKEEIKDDVLDEIQKDISDLEAKSNSYDDDNISELENEIEYYENLKPDPTVATGTTYSGFSDAGSTVVPERNLDYDAMDAFSEAQESFPPVPYGGQYAPQPPTAPYDWDSAPIATEVEGEGVKKKKKLTPKSILKSYTKKVAAPAPRLYVPPQPELRRATNDKDKEALLKIIDAMRLILN